MKNKAFTLIEVLVTLIVLNLFFLMLGFFASNLIAIEAKTHNDMKNEFEVFMAQLELESAEGTFIRITNVTYLQIEITARPTTANPERSKLIFQKYKNMIRKTTNSGGHQPLLMNVKTAQFTLNEAKTHVAINIKFLNGEEVDGKWVIS